MAYPDRVGVRRSGRGVFQLSGGSGAANVPDSDPLSREAIWRWRNSRGRRRGRGNDRARLAAPVPASALEPGGCLHEHLCETRDRVAWAVASKAVVARRLLAVGEAVLRETPYAPEPEDTVPAMLEGVRAMARARRSGLVGRHGKMEAEGDVAASRRRGGGGRDASGPRRRRARRDDGRVVSAAPPGRRVGVGAAKTGRRRSAPCMLTRASSSEAVDDAASHARRRAVGVETAHRLRRAGWDAGASREIAGTLRALGVAARGDRGTVAVEVHLLSPRVARAGDHRPGVVLGRGVPRRGEGDAGGGIRSITRPEDPTTAEATHRSKPKKRK